MAQEADNILDVADHLRLARKQQKLSIEAVAKEICVRVCYLNAIEERRYDELPGKTFVVGFVKSYAKMLKLDPQALSEQFKSDYAAFCSAKGSAGSSIISSNGLSSVRDQSINDHRIKLVAPTKRQWHAWLSPAVGLVGAGMSWFLVGANYTVSSIATIDPVVEERTLAALTNAQLMHAPSTESVSGETAISADQPVTADSDIAVRPAEHTVDLQAQTTTSMFLSAAHADNHVPAGIQSDDITLQAVEDSWIQLFYQDGTEMWSGVLRSGQSFRPQLIGEVYLTTSNAGGIILNGSDASLGPLGPRGSVIEALALDSLIFEAETFSDAGFSSAPTDGSD